MDRMRRSRGLLRNHMDGQCVIQHLPRCSQSNLTDSKPVWIGQQVTGVMQMWQVQQPHAMMMTLKQVLHPLLNSLQQVDSS